MSAMSQTVTLANGETIALKRNGRLYFSDSEVGEPNATAGEWHQRTGSKTTEEANWVDIPEGLE